MVYTLWQPAVMEQFCAEDRSKDIFHTSPMMHTFTYAEQQFLKWALMFCYKLAIPSDQYLIFFFCQSFGIAEQFFIWRGYKSFFSGVYIYFNEMWPKCLAKCELKFYCQTSNNMKYM